MSEFMLRAIELARKAEGKTSPNPMVGAVIVKDGKIIGEGFHQYAGAPHAEIDALRKATLPVKGAKLYINLEPCCHFGKTPPCTNAIIEAGISEVHMAILDPNPLINGKGKSILENAGIKTVVGSCATEAQKLNEVFCHWIQQQTPFVIAKFAMSLDGKIATHTGHSKWITTPASRAYVHKMRNRMDAILVGVNTIIADDPELTTRIDGLTPEQVSHPIRIVLDSKGRIPKNAKILSPQLSGKTIIVTEKKQYLNTLPTNIEIIEVPKSTNGICLQKLLQILSQKNICSILVEGGGTVLASFFEQQRIHKVFAFIAPIIIGGTSAKTPVEGYGATQIATAQQLTNIEVTKISDDVLITGYCKQNHHV